MTPEKNIEHFNEDIRKRQSYQYTGPLASLSSRLANQRLSEAVRQMTNVQGKDILDAGCGDGSYTLEFLEFNPRQVLGIDAAASAIELAQQKTAHDPRIQFRCLDIYRMGELGRHFDIAIVRGLLHHLYEPEKAIRELSKVAKEIIVIEPNGSSPILKIIEKVSPYHREHEEKSFTRRSMVRRFERSGAQCVAFTYCGLVPMFCPDWLAKILKRIEPLVERLPLFRQLLCAVYVIKLKGAMTS